MKKKRGRPKGSRSKVSRSRRPRHQFLDLLGPIKTNTPEGRRLYYRLYMRQKRGIEPSRWRGSYVVNDKLDLNLLKPGAVEEIMKILKGKARK